MADLLHCYLLFAALHISGAFGSLFFVHEDPSQRQEWDKPSPKPEWDNEVLQNIRRFYSLDTQRFLRSKFYDNMKYHQSHFPAGWAIQVQSVTNKASTVPVAKPGFREGLPKAMPIENIRLDPITRSGTNERGEHSPGLQQSVDAAQQNVPKREPTEMTRETLDFGENSTIIESPEKTGHPDSVDASESGNSGEEVKKETDDIISTEETGTTEVVTDNSALEKATTTSVHGKVDEGITSTVDGRSSERISPSTAHFPATTVTVSETVSSILQTTDSKHTTIDGSSSKGITPSTTDFPATTVTVSKTVPSILSTTDSKLSTVDGSSSSGISFSMTHFPATTVTVSTTLSTATPEHEINMPRIRTAKIVISSVLLAIGLVAVAVMAVCIFRERRKAVKYDQLKLLP